MSLLINIGARRRRYRAWGRRAARRVLVRPDAGILHAYAAMRTSSAFATRHPRPWSSILFLAGKVSRRSKSARGSPQGSTRLKSRSQPRDRTSRL